MQQYGNRKKEPSVATLPVNEWQYDCKNDCLLIIVVALEDRKVFADCRRHSFPTD